MGRSKIKGQKKPHHIGRAFNSNQIGREIRGERFLFPLFVAKVQTVRQLPA